MTKAALIKETIEFLASLPTIDEPKTRQALLYAACLDQNFSTQIAIEGNTDQFVTNLVRISVGFGTLQDGRLAIVAVLETAKKYIGTEGQKKADELIQEWQKGEKPIEFVNRLNEISFITNVHCPPYLLISAPMGYGKSRLLDAIRPKLEQQNWFCVSIRCSREIAYSLESLTSNFFRQILPDQNEPDGLTPERAGEMIGRHLLQKQQNVILLIDEVERIEPELAKDLINRCLVTIQNVLSRSGKTLRLMLAGRYIEKWKQISELKIPLESIYRKPLTPFDFEAVQQTVNLFDASYNFRTFDDYRREFASHLMYFTGGHPRCMAQILSDDFVGTIDDREEVYYQKIVKAVVEEILSHIPAKLCPIFETLSVVRRFNARFLQQLIDKGIIEWDQGDAYNLEDRLRKTFLINKKEGFLQDDMSRRLLAIHLRQTNPEQYSKVCTEAISFYESCLQDVESLKPDLLAVEWLFQKLQWLYYSQKRKKEDFFDCFPELLDILKSRRYAAEIIENVVDRLDDINEEWEFRFLCNYCLREGIYDNKHPFKDVIEHLTNLAQPVKGERNHA